MKTHDRLLKECWDAAWKASRRAHLGDIVMSTGDRDDAYTLWRRTAADPLEATYQAGREQRGWT